MTGDGIETLKGKNIKMFWLIIISAILGGVALWFITGVMLYAFFDVDITYFPPRKVSRSDK